MTINDRVFTLLRDSIYTQKQFCASTGIPEKTLSAWKVRKSDPPAALISTIADFFAVSVEYLLTGMQKDTLNTNVEDDERELLMTYQQLDSRGKYKIQTVAYEELDRVRATLDPEQPNQVG